MATAGGGKPLREIGTRIGREELGSAGLGKQDEPAVEPEEHAVSQCRRGNQRQMAGQSLPKWLQEVRLDDTGRVSIDTSGVTGGTVPGTVPGVVQTVTSEAFPAASCGRVLAAMREVSCRLNRKEVCRAIRTASRNATCRGIGKVIVMVTRKGTSDAVCRGTSDVIGSATVLGLGTRAGKTGRQSLGAPASFHEEAKAGTVPDGRQMGTVPRSACVGLSAVQSPFARDSPRFPGVTSPPA